MKRGRFGLSVAAAAWPALLASGQAVDPKVRPTSATAGCTTSGCHAEITSVKVPHGPVAVQKCDACHTVANEKAHKFAYTRERAELCYFCHDAYQGRLLHDPVAKGDCLGCHNAHGGATRQMLKAASVRDACVACHTDVAHGKSMLHGPVAAGGCTACHDAHRSEHKGLLVKAGNALCLDCHASVEQRMTRAASIHEPVKTDCLRCHTPHASDEKMQLVSDAETLCLSCHENIKSTVQHAKTAHGAVVEGRKCMNCHDPHSAAHPRILRNNPMALCMECHNKAIDTPQGRVGDLSAVLASGKSLHGPVAEQNCSACHEIHGGSNFRLLTKEYPPEFYAPFKEESYALCFSCHEKSIVHDARTTTLTGFRNGDVNLHYLHVNKDTKGRTCRACHETHASDHEKHIRDTVPFGKWEMPIGFEKTVTGGSCAPGCHQQYTYDRERPVTYKKAATPATWPDAGARPPGGAASGGS